MLADGAGVNAIGSKRLGSGSFLPDAQDPDLEAYINKQQHDSHEQILPTRLRAEKLCSGNVEPVAIVTDLACKVASLTI